MKKKSTQHKAGRAAMSPLLRALTYSRDAREPMVNGMLIQCYTALDAFHRGHGSQALFMTLCRHLLVAEELCQLGHAPDYADDITRAHEALVGVDTRHTGNDQWTLDASDYAHLCDALTILSAQLDDASLEHIAQAEARMVTQSLIAANMRSGHKPDARAMHEELASSMH
ncbi:hypothetical protein BVER_01947 [Candidatus Burkholderia verschuerenii]|uniref:Uncharacterized protein n=1 Tax=Candidatus Burkholderia verschuerenii TaxID=242163 RepID=A0A0L0MIM6_9BURK|nr:hypothetical protein [Candidatus Burkholderia verschuerenii]KND62155.1 hypothetical protein BVER_01947 [Candidatus Burkholderia verschuerenii]